MAAAISASPDMASVADAMKRQPTITYLDRNGSVLGVRGGRYGPPVDVDKLPSYIPAAFVSIEDRRFYQHEGFDALGMARALAADVAHGRIVEGASTITQQLARNLFLTPDQTMQRKAQELVLAVQLERRYSKKQILGLYLSRVYYGGGAYGLEAAAHRFYDKPASALTLSEAATLAGVLKSPTNYSPVDEPEHAEARSHLVLDAMVETGAITPALRARALAHPAHANPASGAVAAQYFVDWINGKTMQAIGSLKEDLVVDTTLDLPAERAAAGSVTAVTGREKRLGVAQAALVSLDGEGRVRAMVGGTAYASSQFNRAIEAHRQAGSAWKPFVYLTAMEAGRTPDVKVMDEPVTINGWSPHNYEAGYRGEVTLQQALAHSINTVAARLADEVGRENVAITARRVGIVSRVDTDPAMALGSTLVTPLEMAQAYTPFSNGGLRAQAFGLERIRTAAGRVLYQHRSDAPRSVIANPALSEMNLMLRSVVTEGTGTRAAIRGYDIAGKTGTTSDYKDAWFCGYSDGLATVVWVGRDDNAPMKAVTGGGPPAEIWRGYMTSALPRFGAHAIPQGPEGVPVSLPASPEPAVSGAPMPQDPVDALLRPPPDPSEPTGGH